MNHLQLRSASRLIVGCLGVLLASACSRSPVAQLSLRTENQVTAAPSLAPVTMPADTTSLAMLPARPEALVRNETAPTVSNRVEKRMARVRTLLTTRSSTPTVAPKLTLVQKLAVRKLNQMVRKHQSPSDTSTNTTTFRTGLVVGVIGLLLILIGNSFIALLGGLALVAGIVLVVLSLLDVI